MTRIDEAGTYAAPGHFDVRTLRLQGAEATPVENFTVGLSVFLPAGGCEMSATPLEKVYVVIEGEVTIVTESGEAVLGPLDSIYLAPSEARAIENRTNHPAQMLVVMPPVVPA
ncbi:MAG: cupin domain-containing protein [Solirubrobacterales bacterium]